ncbi:NarK family nitrate/nitrite MFS transporter [Vibrio casei]|uniref:Nitrate/nitrite transporter n=1 Tax=Vibrio casei TaxID=673372 RepID=A0A368LHG3_9VIBR|nr:NarK family nitrate/nitrite MFS transporter [Vibrio casei]RCS70065.1 NarK family nitrate/nitrite MFS transporter [Vibrio casei]SJN34125.1 Nitrate/nitrite transporter [Vibrio casei]
MESTIHKSKNISKVLTHWVPEDPTFWQQEGQHIARKNLWISIPCLLLSFCVWMMFSTVSINLNRVGFTFTTDQLFLLTALPSASGAIMRIPYSFMVPIIGGRRWTAFTTAFLAVPCIWLSIAVQDPNTLYSIFVLISLLCGFAGGNFASSMSNISFFFPKHKQGGALGLNGGLGNLGVSVMQLFAPLTVSMGIFSFFVSGSQQPDGSMLWLANAPLIWVPFIVITTLAAWFGMNDIATAKASISDQLPVLKRPHMWVLSFLYLSTFGSFIGFSAGFAMLTKTQFPTVDIIHIAFLGPLLGAFMRPVGGALSDKLGGIKVTTINFVLMAIFTASIFYFLPGEASANGNFKLFFIGFMLLFATAGLGSGSTFQMIAVVFRQLTVERMLRENGGNEEKAQARAIKDSAAALGFISAIGAIGGFFIPKAFGTSLALTGSPIGAMKVFLGFYIVCVILTWAVYGRYEKK